MRARLLVSFSALAAAATLGAPITVQGPEQGQLDLRLPDGGLPPAPGVQNIQIWRSSGVSNGCTYAHHVDMACWKGRLYVAWSAIEKDEDVWPWREVYSTSTNGFTWSEPVELFPQGVSNPLRMHFFHAPNGRMLAIAGLRRAETKLTDKNRDTLVVREIRDDHTLGPVYSLLTPEPVSTPEIFTNSADNGFVEACHDLLANRPFLEQQDYGALLGERKMKWHENEGLQLKAMSLFHRKDGALVGICKKGWTTVSTDDGATWSKPVIPVSLITGTGKVWGQRTSDGRFALVYNPDPTNRFPLVIVTGEDGATFRDMRVVHGELPLQRYAGLHKNVGPQYVRGISEWSSDGSWKDKALWVAYSVNKEDIWVSRIPLANSADSWNTYSPKWAPVEVVKDGANLEDRDPHDYARAVRLFPAKWKITVSFRVLTYKCNYSWLLEVELLGGSNERCPVRLEVTKKDWTGDRLVYRIEADAQTGRFSVFRNDTPVIKNAALAHPMTAFTGISFRTGPPRPIIDRAKTSVTDDVPTGMASYSIHSITIR